jgi:phage gpG-like protein
MDNANINGLDDVLRKLNAAKNYIKNDAPTVMGVLAVNHFKGNFQNERFDNGEKWKDRRIPPRLQRNILTGQGTDHLVDSIKFEVNGNTITISTDRKYAQIHNEGGTIDVIPEMRKFFWAMYFKERDEAGLQKGDPDNENMEKWKMCAKAKKITIPKREFIGNSPVLNQKITDKITRDLTKILNA